MVLFKLNNGQVHFLIGLKLTVVFRYKELVASKQSMPSQFDMRHRVVIGIF
jgi:hypothetical protein